MAFPLFSREHPIEVSYKGQVRVFIPFTVTALCPINVKYFPYDVQECRYVFGSWSYTTQMLEYSIKNREINLNNFYDNQEWMLLNATISEGSTDYNFSNLDELEFYSTIILTITIQRQSFFYVFNLVVPTALVTLVAIVGFHTPQAASTLRQSKSRLGITTLLSMGVMLLMVVDELPKFALQSIPGNYGSFSDVPILGIFYMSLIGTISMGTFTSTIFIHLEQFALYNPHFSSVPHCLRWLNFRRKNTTKKQTYVSRDGHSFDRENHVLDSESKVQPKKVHEIHRSQHEKLLTENNHNRSPLCRPTIAGKKPECFDDDLNLDCLIFKIDSILEEIRRFRDENSKNSLKKGRNILAPHWHRIINRLERISLLIYLLVVLISTLLLFFPSWY